MTMAIPGAEKYEAVGVKAYTGSTNASLDDTPCSTYPRQVLLEDQTKRLEDVGPGCVIMKLRDDATKDDATSED